MSPSDAQSILTHTLSRRQFRVMDNETLALLADRWGPHYDTPQGYQNFLRAHTELKRRAASA